MANIPCPVESVKAIFKKRSGKKRFYILCLVVLVFLTDLPVGVNSVEFMYVKRRFQWEVDQISYYSTFLNAASNIGLLFYGWWANKKYSIPGTHLVSCRRTRIEREIIQ